MYVSNQSTSKMGDGRKTSETGMTKVQYSMLELIGR